MSSGSRQLPVPRIDELQVGVVRYLGRRSSSQG